MIAEKFIESRPRTEIECIICSRVLSQKLLRVCSHVVRECSYFDVYFGMVFEKE